MSTSTLEASTPTRSIRDSIDIAQRMLGLDARWERMGGNIGAVVIPVPGFGPVDREVLIGDAGDLLTYSDGVETTVETFMVCGYYNGEPVVDGVEVPATASPQVFAAAIHRAFRVAQTAR